MSVVVRKAGFTSQVSYFGTRAVVNRSDGSAVMVVYDPNIAAAPVGYGDGTGVAKLHVYHSIDRDTWALRASITLPATLINFTVNIASNDLVGIAASFTDRAIRFASVSSAWTASSWATVNSWASTQSNRDIDLSFTDGNMPVVTVARLDTANPKLRVMAFARRLSDNGWVVPVNFTVLSTQNPKLAYSSVSCVALTGGTATARNFVIALGHGTGTNDRGVNVYTVQLIESTGLSVGGAGLVLRDNVAKGFVPGNSNINFSRNVMLFNGADNEYILGIQHAEGARNMVTSRGSFDGTNWTRTHPPGVAAMGTKILVPNMSMTYSSERLAFHYAVATGDLVSHYATFDDEFKSTSFTTAWRYWDNKSRPASLSPLGGSGPNVEFPTHDLIFLWREANNKQSWCHHYARPSVAPQGVVPTGGTVVATSTPVLRAKADLDIQYPQTRTKLRWEIASDAAFTTNLRAYEQEDEDFKYVENTHLPNSFVPFEDVLSNDFSLKQGNWFIRAAHVDEFDVVGAYSPVQQFNVSHPPKAADIVPNSSRAVAFGNGTVLVDWRFTDPFEFDTQTAYRIQVETNDDASSVVETNKVSSVETQGNITISSTFKSRLLRGRIKLWDADDVEGDWSDWFYFIASDAPTSTITSLTTGQTITTAIPNITTRVNFIGDRSVVYGRVLVRQAGKIVHDSGPIPVLLDDNQTWNYVPPIELLANNTTYTFESSATDSWGLTGPPSTVTATTGWVPPAPAAGVTVDAAPYNTEGQGYVSVRWDDTARDVDFSAWNVFRKTDYINPNTQEVLEVGSWRQLPNQQTQRQGQLVVENYAPNPKFQNDTTGWSAGTGTGGTGERIADSRYAGGFLYRVTMGSGGSTPFIQASQPYDAASAAATVDLGATTTAARNFRAQIRFVASNGTILAFTTVDNIPTNAGISTITIPKGAAPAGTVTVNVIAYFTNGFASGETISMTRLYLGPEPSAYFDGDTEDTATNQYAWNGAQGASKSSKRLPDYNEYQDYGARSGYRVSYKVEQEVTRFGDVLASSSAFPVAIIPISESYWLVQPDTKNAFRLGNVTGDQFTDEYEEESFHVVGRGRHVDTGDRLGYSGTLTAQVRDGQNMTARQKRLRMETIKQESRKLYMRNPFGDYFRVNVSSMQYTRIAGTGTSEFFDLSIPYEEVGE